VKHRNFSDVYESTSSHGGEGCLLLVAFAKNSASRAVLFFAKKGKKFASLSRTELSAEHISEETLTASIA
jgi:hypothetical protein